MNIFERASRAKLRFDSNVGAITTEQLWDLPLTTRSGKRDALDLDTVGRAIVRELNSITTESLVETKPDPRKTDLELKLEIVKHVIASKQADAAAAEARAAKIEKKSKILEALATAETRELAGKSKEELLKELEAIDA